MYELYKVGARDTCMSYIKSMPEINVYELKVGARDTCMSYIRSVLEIHV